jgi:serine/threonine protein kinase
MDEPFKVGSEAETQEKTLRDAFATTRNPEDPIIGTMVGGRYRMQRKLGHGGFGVIYLAADEKMLSRPVVVKALHDEGIGNEWSARKFKQEIEALARIDHPSIVGIFDVGEMPDGKPYIVMQYVDGFSLRSLITPEGLDFWRAANIMRQTGRALSAAHDRGILHRDLKPENIMVQTLGGGDEQVKIIDFGIARVKNSVVSFTTASDKTVGTIAYMSPEQLIASQLTPASDVYCLAVIAYELLTGRRPVNPESGYQLLEMQRAGVRIRPTDLRPGLPQQAEAIILKALSFEAGKRPQRARDFGDELASALVNDEPTVVPSASQSLTEVLPVGVGDTSSEITAVRPPPSKWNLKRLGIIAAATLAVSLLTVFAISKFIKPREAITASPAVVVPANDRSYRYWLTVQKMRAEKPDGGEIAMTGNEIYGNGWKFRFNFEPAQSGSLYLLNESPGPPDKREFNALFPTPKTGGRAQLDRYQRLQTLWNRFDEKTGVEKLWIIWAVDPVPELDELFRNAGQTGGVLSEDQVASVQTYLEKYQSKETEVAPDKQQNFTLVKGQGNILVSLQELTHTAY